MTVKSIKIPKPLNAFTLKVIAMLLMLCDHMWATDIVPERFMTDLGRIAFPIFAFQLAEGFFYTHNRKKMLVRLLIFALISEIPFNLMYSGNLFYPFHQNVVWTLLLAMLLMCLLEKVKNFDKPILYILVTIFVLLLGFLSGTLLLVDYYGYGVVTVLLFYLTRKQRFGWLVQVIVMYGINVVMLGGLVLPFELFGLSFEFPQQGIALLSLPLIWLYNGRLGPHSKVIQYTYYAFYPLHMLILACICLFT